MTGHGEFTCDNCRRTFGQERSDQDAEAEARTAGFTEAELADPAVVCDDCWQAMRAAMPDLDDRYPQETRP
jgi:hypothetical protein